MPAHARAIGVRTIVTIALFVALFSPQIGHAAQADLSTIFISKIVEPGAFGFESCVIGTSILPGGTVNYPGNPQGALTLSLDEGEWCYEEIFGSQAALDAAFPSNGVRYTLSIPSDVGTFDYYVDYLTTKPEAAPVLSNPVDASNVLSDRTLVARWTLSAACPMCDGFIAEFDSNAGSSTLFLVPWATSQAFASALVDTGPGNEFFISVFDGVANSTPPAQNGDTFQLSALYEVAVFADFTGVTRTMDIERTEMFKGVERDNGTIGAGTPYFYEACTVGSGLASSSVSTPTGIKVLVDEGGGEFCYEEQFADMAALDAAYPSEGEAYTFILEQADGALADVATVFDEEPPASFAVATNPVDQDTVPAGQDLTVTWTLDLGTPPCTVGLDCGDGSGVFIEDLATFNDVFAADGLPITTMQTIVPMAALTGGPNFRLEIETFSGIIGASEMDGDADTFESVLLWEDINLTTFMVPEPAQGVAQIAALMTLAGIARRRRARRGAPTGS